MKYVELVRLFAKRPFFETTELDVLYDEPIEQIQARLSRWVYQEKLLQLRRGKYLLPLEFRQINPSEYFISNFLYRPSYISMFTALEIYGLIPESVETIEAVTTRQTAIWNTKLGRYKYTSIKQNRFWGYKELSQGSGVRNEQQKYLCATPEKALLDLFYFHKGKWTENRILEMRLQNLNKLDMDQLSEFSRRMASYKVSLAVEKMMKVLF